MSAELVVLASAASSGLVLALAGSPHCAGMCGPLAATASSRGGWRHVLGFSAGKLATYVVLGMLAGTVGTVLFEVRVVGFAVSAIIIGWVALQLLGVIPEPRFGARWFGRLMGRAGRAGPSVAGAAAGLLPCGLVYAALGIGLSTGTVAGGALVMLAFGVGTSPALLLAGQGAHRLRQLGPWGRRALAVLVIAGGAWALAHRAPSAVETDSPQCHIEPLESAAAAGQAGANHAH